MGFHWITLQAGSTVFPAFGTLAGIALMVATTCWILQIKKNPTSAVAWCLLVVLVPVFGLIVFWFFGYQHVHRPMKRRRGRKESFEKKHKSKREATKRGTAHDSIDSPAPEATHAQWSVIARLAQRGSGFPITFGNHIRILHEGEAVFAAMRTAILSARHHVHLESYIFHCDEVGCPIVNALCEKARAGVQVRLLYDAIGTRRLPALIRKQLSDSGVQWSTFLPISPLHRRIQVNMRNHRKILVIDGEVGFVGGMNIGNEYIGKGPRFDYWKDSHARLEGAAVASLQRVFLEDWHFASNQLLDDAAFYPDPRRDGNADLQIVESGPDQNRNAIRDIIFAAIIRARKRIWFASPYFVPDAGLLDAVCSAARLGVDVRFLGLHYPDKLLPYFAARYFWTEALSAGVKIYQYTRGMMHSKIVLVDSEWGSIGSANFDNRSLHLNFEANCLVYSPHIVAELEEAFCDNLQDAIRLSAAIYSRRPLPSRALENACRLFAPVL